MNSVKTGLSPSHFPVKLPYAKRPGHRLRTPNEAFFHWNPELLGLGRQIGQIHFGAFGVFSAELSVPILVQWVPCPWFPLFNHYIYKKVSLYIHIQNIYLGLGFEFGPQRIFLVSVVRGPGHCTARQKNCNWWTTALLVQFAMGLDYLWILCTFNFTRFLFIKLYTLHKDPFK